MNGQQRDKEHIIYTTGLNVRRIKYYLRLQSKCHSLGKKKKIINKNHTKEVQNC